MTSLLKKTNIYGLPSQCGFYFENVIFIKVRCKMKDAISHIWHSGQSSPIKYYRMFTDAISHIWHSGLSKKLRLVY